MGDNVDKDLFLVDINHISIEKCKEKHQAFSAGELGKGFCSDTPDPTQLRTLKERSTYLQFSLEITGSWSNSFRI